MQLNIKQLGDGFETLPFSLKADLSHLRMWGEAPFPIPVTVEGEVTRQTEGLTVRYRADYRLHAACARCLIPVEEDKSAQFTHLVLETSGEEEDDLPGDGTLHAPGGLLAVEEMAAADLLLTLENVVLCGEGCKGLCPKCGANRNTSPCGCDTRVPDSRFDALRKYLQS